MRDKITARIEEYAASASELFHSPVAWAIAKRIVLHDLSRSGLGAITLPGVVTAMKDAKNDFLEFELDGVRCAVVNEDYKEGFMGTPENDLVIGYLSTEAFELPPEEILAMFGIVDDFKGDEITSLTLHPESKKEDEKEVEAIFEDIEVMNDFQRKAFDSAAVLFRREYTAKGYFLEEIEDAVHRAKTELGCKYSPRKGYAQFEAFI